MNGRVLVKAAVAEGPAVGRDHESPSRPCAGGSLSRHRKQLMGLVRTSVLGVCPQARDRIALLATYGFALTGGTTMYVAASNLVPEF